MSYAHRHTVAVTTAADGTATAYTSEPITGRIVNVVYTKTDFANGVVFAITGEETGITIWGETAVNASKTVSPVQAAHLNTTGGASAITQAPVVVATERIKIAVSLGGATKTGSFEIVVA